MDGEAGAYWLAVVVCLSRRDIQGYKHNSLLFIWVSTQLFGKIP